MVCNLIADKGKGKIKNKKVERKMEIKIEITQAEALRLADALEYKIKRTKRKTKPSSDYALIQNLREAASVVLMYDKK